MLARSRLQMTLVGHSSCGVEEEAGVDEEPRPPPSITMSPLPPSKSSSILKSRPNHIAYARFEARLSDQA